MAKMTQPPNITLSDVREQIDRSRISFGHYEVNDYTPWGQIRCSRCSQLILEDEPVCWKWQNEPVRNTRSEAYATCQPEVVTHIEIWHFACQPEE